MTPAIVPGSLYLQQHLEIAVRQHVLYTVRRITSGFMIVLTIGAILLSFAGCTTSGTQVSRAQSQQFKPGVTTEQDVVAVLGQPQTEMDAPDGHWLIYTGMRARVKATSFIPLVGLFAGGAHSELDSVKFCFGSDGKLTHVDNSHYSADAHAGL